MELIVAVHLCVSSLYDFSFSHLVKFAAFCDEMLCFRFRKDRSMSFIIRKAVKEDCKSIR